MCYFSRKRRQNEGNQLRLSIKQSYVPGHLLRESLIPSSLPSSVNNSHRFKLSENERRNTFAFEVTIVLPAKLRIEIKFSWESAFLSLEDKPCYVNIMAKYEQSKSSVLSRETSQVSKLAATYYFSSVSFINTESVRSLSFSVLVLSIFLIPMDMAG